MKYAKQLAQDIRDISPTLQGVSISYKAWKKRCKALDAPDSRDALATLQQECDKVNKLFVAEYERWASPMLLTSLCCGKCPHSPNEILTFARINATTVYKICKRMQRMQRLQDPQFSWLSWLSQTRSSHIYEFMGGADTTHLQVHLQMHTEHKPIECPICLEEHQHKLLIFACGHNACLHCSLEYAGVKNMRGTWYNLLSCAKKTTCPVCKFEKALLKTIYIT